MKVCNYRFFSRTDQVGKKMKFFWSKLLTQLEHVCWLCPGWAAVWNLDVLNQLQSCPCCVLHHDERRLFLEKPLLVCRAWDLLVYRVSSSMDVGRRAELMHRISCYHSDEWAAVHLSLCHPQRTFHCFVYWAAVFKIKNSQMFHKILRGTALVSLIRLSMSLFVSFGWWSQSAWSFSHLKDALRWHASSHKGCWSYHTAELVTVGVLHFNCGFSNEILQKQCSLLCTSEFLFVREAFLEKKYWGNTVVDRCTATALQERKKLQQVLYERPRTVIFQWVKGEKPPQSSNILYEYGFWSCFACKWISFSFKSQFQRFNHNTRVLEKQGWETGVCVISGLDSWQRVSSLLQRSPEACMLVKHSILELGPSCGELAFTEFSIISCPGVL